MIRIHLGLLTGMAKFHSSVVVPGSSSLQGKQEPHLKKKQRPQATSSNFEQVASSLFVKLPSQQQKQGLPSSWFRAAPSPLPLWCAGSGFNCCQVRW